ncbi:MAG: lamin tail domain-containing protein, partial [candidate division WOR-3 bacterium]
VINEFLPRPGFDWNNDGTIDVFDEFIEVENLGPIDVDLANWKLDDEANLGSPPFTLPSKKLKPGERALFYGSTTHILLDDGGDSVRLINPRGVIVDARTYGVIKLPDQSYCRIPDGEGYWRHPCFPTPGLENTLSGSLPSPPPTKAAAPPPCLLADTVPSAFRAAECSAFGAEVWNRKYWDEQGGEDLFLVPDPFSKWLTFVE